MLHLILRYLGTVAAVLLTIRIVPGITALNGWTTIFLAALAWSVLVTLIRPILVILTLPITIITFGLFAFILNALLFYALTFIVPGFVIDSFWTALIGSLVLSILAWFIHQLL